MSGNQILQVLHALTRTTRTATPPSRLYGGCIGFKASERGRARDPKLLALVTHDVVQNYGMEGEVEQVEFYESDPYAGSANERPYATGLVFAKKVGAEDIAALAGIDLSEATHSHGAYVFEGNSGL